MTVNQGVDDLYKRNLLQTFHQQRSLMWRRFFKLFRQDLKPFCFFEVLRKPIDTGISMLYGGNGIVFAASRA